MATAAELRQILKEDAGGKNLYDHLTETLMKILIDRPNNAFDSFELISAEIKANPLTPDPEKGKPIPPSADELEKQLNWVKNSSMLFKVPEEPAEESPVKFPDLLDEANLLEWAGISLGKLELYNLFLSIKKISESLPSEVEKIRFFGRISTRSLPYYILEGISPEEEEGIDELKQEGKAGGNRYAYWVTQNIESAQWTKLPNVTMDQIVKSRLFKRLLTGNLDALVPSYPPFNGTEKNLLRAIIGRIVGATSISPDGFYDLDDAEDPPVVKPAEAEGLNERFPKPSVELKEADAWKHHEIDLNKIGRVLAMPEPEEGAEPVDGMEPVDPNPPLDAIKPECWTFRICPGGSGAASGSAVVARSIVWPGAVAVVSGKKYTNIYMGNGVMYEAKAYSPPLPAPIQTEYKIQAATEGEESEEGWIALIEQTDVKVDPTPPQPEGEEDEG